MRKSIIEKFGKSKLSITPAENGILLTLVGVKFKSSPSIIDIEITKDSLVYVYFYSEKNNTYHILIYGHVGLLEDVINRIADEVSLTLEEREYLIDLPNIKDNRPQTQVTLLRSDYGNDD